MAMKYNAYMVRVILSTVLMFFSYTIFCGNNDASLASYNYDNNYKDYAMTHKQDVAVLVAAYNRPEYFIQCIQSIEQNPQVDSLVFIFALDGGPESKQDENRAIVDASRIRHKIFLLHDRNYGCPKNHIDSKRFAFEWCGFKKVIVMEEDVVVTPHYFTFLLNLHSWATQEYDNIGATQAWLQCYLSIEEKAEQLNYVQEDPMYWSFVTYCIDNRCWQKIRHIMYTFEDFVDQIPHTDEYAKQRSKPALWHGMQEIRQWVHSMVEEKIQQKQIIGPSSLASKLSLTNEFLSPQFLAAQDVIMGFAFYMCDLIKLQSIVNRVIHIGAHGISTNEELYNVHYKAMNLDIFERDKFLKNFLLQ